MNLKNYNYPELSETKVDSEWQSLVKELLETLNASRETAGYKKLSVGAFLGQLKKAQGDLNTAKLRDIRERAFRFNSFSTGISFFMKNKL